MSARGPRLHIRRDEARASPPQSHHRSGRLGGTALKTALTGSTWFHTDHRNIWQANAPGWVTLTPRFLGHAVFSTPLERGRTSIARPPGVKPRRLLRRATHLGGRLAGRTADCAHGIYVVSHGSQEYPAGQCSGLGNINTTIPWPRRRATRH